MNKIEVNVGEPILNVAPNRARQDRVHRIKVSDDYKSAFAVLRIQRPRGDSVHPLRGAGIKASIWLRYLTSGQLICNGNEFAREAPSL